MAIPADHWGANVAAYRYEANLTQTELAALCGVSVAMIASVERGRRHPGLVLAHRLADVLGVDGRDMFPF